MTTQASPIQRRARAQLSCTLCRSGKLKCDRGHPCDQCVKRSKDAQCHYQPAPKKKPRKPTSTKDRIAQLENLVVKLMNQESAAASQARNELDSASPQSRNDEPVQELTPESRATLSSPEQLDGSDGEAGDDSDAEVSDGGRISITNGGANYVGGAHWESILSRIEQLKTTVNGESDELLKQNERSEAAQAQSRLLLIGSPTVTKEYLIQACPNRETAERLLFAWFNSHNPLLPLMHRPTFLIEYERFLQNPSEVPMAWLGMYYGILSLGCEVSRPQHPSSSIGGLAKEAVHYQTLSGEALILADIAKPQKYLVEALMTAAATEHLRGDAGNPLRLWLILSVVLRLCMRMGFHRDPSLLKSLSAFECEMRRRVWYVVYIFDVLVSFSMGLPDMIRQIQSDTRAPRNLVDTDFGPETIELPHSRPLTELTPVAYSIVKSRIAKLFARAADISHSIAHPDSKVVAAIDEELEEVYGRIPDSLKFVSMRHCMFDPPPVIFNRFKLQLLYQKTRCVLYRRYLASKNPSPEEEEFREKCAGAAVNLLKHWEVLHDASQQGGQLATMPFFLDSLSVADFLLAVMIACLELDNLRSSKTALDAKAQERLASIKAALESTYRVHSKSKNDKHAGMPAKALKALEAILNKANIKAPEPATSSGPSTVESVTYPTPQSLPISVDGSINAQVLPTSSASYSPNGFSWQEPLNNNFANNEAINWQMWDASLRNSMLIDQPAAIPCVYDGIDMNLDMVGGIGGFNNFDGSMSTDFTTTANWFQ